MAQTGAVQTGTSTAKRGLAQMLKGGTIMDVTTADQAKIAEDADAVAGHPVLVGQGALVAATFHPEVVNQPALHRYFLRGPRFHPPLT